MPSVPIDDFKQAILASDAAQLSQLLDRHPELRSQINSPVFSFDSPAVMEAAIRGNRPVIDVLLGAGADVNRRSTWWAGGFGVLDFANTELAEYLIQKGAVVDAHAAARLGMLDKLRELVIAEPGLVRARGGDGKTPLHFASTVEIAEYLLDHGAEIDILDIDHESTAAQYIVQSNPDVVRLLIERGCRTDILMAAAVGDTALAGRHLDADPEAIRTRVNERYFPKRAPRSGGCIYTWTIGVNQSPHQAARRFGHSETVKLLLDRSPAEIQLTDAFSSGDTDAIEALLAKNPDLIALLSKEDRSLITYAARDNDLDAVRLMLRYDWPVAGGDGETPLHWAAFHGDLEMTREILKHAPPLEHAEPVYHATPLRWAVYGSENGWSRKATNYPDVVEALLVAGAKPPEKIGGSEAVKEVLHRRDAAARNHPE